MSTTNAVNGTTADPYAAINGSSTKKKTSDIEAAQDRFMKLLVTQLQTQDPLNPLDNAAVTSQMAQISTVQGIEKLNTTMESLATMYATSQSLSAAGMVGKNALSQGSSITLNADGSATKAGINLPNGADTVAISVYGPNSQLIDTVALGKQNSGVMDFAWDGKDSTGAALPPGKYSFSVAAKKDGNTAVADALAYNKIDAVSWDQGQPVLHLSDGTRKSLSDIYQLGA